MFRDLLLVLLPSVFLLLILFYLFKNYLDKQFEFAVVKTQNEISFPLVIQAHERITLFLERIKPENLFSRILPECESGLEIQKRAIQEIRTELNHNIAQQIYIRPTTWEKIELATQMLISEIIGSDANQDAKSFVISNLSNETLASKELLKQALFQVKIDIQEKF
jgi:hypothetical protein